MNNAKHMAVHMLTRRHVDKNRDVVMFDIDDTLLRPWTSEPIHEMIELHHAARLLGYRIIIMTARPETDWNVVNTAKQLRSHGIVPTELLFVPASKKSDVKRELGHKYNFVLSVGDKLTDLGESMYWLKLPDDNDLQIRSNLYV